MHRYLGLFFLIALASVASRDSWAEDQPFSPPPNGLLLVFDPTPPWVQTNGTAVTGFFADILREMSKLSGVDIAFAELPWARALAISKAAPDVCAIPASMTPERESLFSWVGPVYRSDWKFFTLAESGIAVNSLQDARQYRVGVQNGSSQEKFLVEAGGFNLDAVSSDELNLKNLITKRIDLWAISAEVPWQYVKKTQTKIIPLFTFRSGPVGVACNLRSDFMKISKMRSALSTLQANDKISEIVERFALTQ